MAREDVKSVENGNFFIFIFIYFFCCLEMVLEFVIARD